MTSPIRGYQAWLDQGAILSREAARIINLQIRRDTKSRSDGKGRFRGSLIGDECDRKQALSYMGVEQTATDLRYAASGTWSHLRWQGAGLTMGFLTAIELPVRYGRWFKGTADGLMDDGRIFELKTTRSSLLRRMTAPKEQHIDQVTLYAAAWKVDEMVIVYEGREGLEHKEFNLTLNWDRYDRIIRRVHGIKKVVDTGGLPDMHPACQPKTIMRDYCSFSDTCLHRFVEDSQHTDAPLDAAGAGLAF